MTRAIVVLVLTMAVGVCAGAADDPSPGRWTAEQRKELEAEFKELRSAGNKAYQEGKLVEAGALFEKALDIGRRLYPRQDHPDLAWSLHYLALVRSNQKKPGEAEAFYREAVEMRRRLYGKQDRADLAQSLHNLALALASQKQYEEAEKLHREALAMRRRLHPKDDHAEVAWSLSNLAAVLADRRKYEEAESLHREAVEIRRRLYPKQDHLEIAQSLHNLALVLAERGKHGEAEALYREAVEMRRRLYGKQDRADLAQSLHNLALALASQKQYEEAEKLHREALAMRRRLHPKDDHADVAWSLNNLANVLADRKKYEEAESLHREALGIRRRLYPKGNHAEVAQSLRNLALVLAHREKYEEAKGLSGEALEMYRRLSPSQEFLETLHREFLELNRRLYPKQDHAEVAQSLHNLALVLAERGKHGEAEALYREAVEMRRRLYGKQDRADLAQSLHNLALVLARQQKNEEAEKLHREALAMRRRLHPKDDHADVAWSLNNLANVLADRKKYEEAESLHREALDIRRRLYPKGNHPDLAQSLSNLAMVLLAQGKLADLEAPLREALAVNRRVYPKQDHPDLVESLNRLAIVLRIEGKITEAEVLYREALEMDRRLESKGNRSESTSGLRSRTIAMALGLSVNAADVGPGYRKLLEMLQQRDHKQDHPDLAASLLAVAYPLVQQGKFAEAEPLCREALEMHRRLYPRQDDMGVVVSLMVFASIREGQGKYAEAESLSREALEMNRRLRPGDSLAPLLSLDALARLLRKQEKYEEADRLYHETLRMYRSLTGAYAALRSEGEALSLVSILPASLDGFLANARAMRARPTAVYAEVWQAKAALSRVYERRALAARAAAGTNPRAAALLAELTDKRRRRADLLLSPAPANAKARDKREEEVLDFTREIDTLDRELRRLLPALDRIEKLAQASPVDLQKALPADAVVVDFLRSTLMEQDPKKPGKAGEKQTDSYAAFVLTRDAVAWIDLGPAKPIEEAIVAWREAITADKDIPSAVPAKVQELVWAKVRKAIPEKVKTVYISPDMALCWLPWVALPGDKPGTILLEDYAIAVIPHAVFLLDRLWPEEPLSRRREEVLLVGGVAYDAEPPTVDQPLLDRGPVPLKPGRKPAWAALEGTAAEVKGVAGAANKKKLNPHSLVGEDASATAVLAALPRARYAHLATHGFFADPSFRSAFQVEHKLFELGPFGERVGAGALSPLVMTGVVFAGANRPNTPGRGIVTGEALIDLDLSGLDLAVLSACETGLGDVAGGEGTFGLQRAFHLAGTRDVVASLWKVPDQSTAALMALFYRNLWEKEMPVIEALRQAQLQVYRNPGKIKDFAEGFRGKFVQVPGDGEATGKPAADGKTHPRKWAGFALSGPGR